MAAVWAVFVPVPPAQADVVRPFAPVFSRQTNGSIAITGNTMLSCGTSAACTSALNGSTASSNNNFVMGPVDTDNVGTTSRSSSADVTIPSGARVLFAGLYWGAARTAGNSGSPATGNANQIKFRTPGGGAYTTLTADRIDSLALGTNDYSAYKDVTAQVQGSGAGSYWAADMSAATGQDRYAGWSLVVVLEDPSAPLRDLTVFNGYASVTGTESVNASISGFLTPPSGAVNAKFGTVTYEGDAGLTGDYFAVNSTRLADNQSPSANFFGSRVTAGGANLTNRNPANLNTLGVDAKVIDAPGVIPNGATSANLTFATSGDFYYPAVLTTQVDLYAPAIRGTKTVTNLSGNTPAKVGDTLEYNLSFTNTGDDNAINAVARDPLPANVSYVPGSLRVTAGANTGAKTDAAGDDQGEYVAGDRAVRFRVGTGATAAAGGSLVKNATTSVRFQVKVDSAAAGTTLRNTGVLDYRAQTLANNYSYNTEEVLTPVGREADVSLTKTGDPATVDAGNNVTYTLGLGNAGPSPADDVVVSDTLPQGVELVSATPTQGACATEDRTITCTVGTVAPGANPSITVVVRVPPGSTATGLTNVAAVTTSTSDPNPANNNASASTAVRRSADVALTKSVTPASPRPGQQVEYTLTTTNNGPSTANEIALTDTVPSGIGQITATTPDGTCSVTGSEVSCARPSLAPGQSMTVTVTGTLDPAYTGGALTNTARVQSQTQDPTPGNNQASATVTPAAPAGDLRVTKTTQTTPVVAGQPVRYLISVTNDGPSTSRAVTISDDTAAALAGVAATTTTGTCTVTAGTVDCALGDLAPGTTAQVTVDATVAPDATGALTNAATADSTTTDPTPGNNTGTTTDQVTGRADLEITKSATPVPVIDGQDVTYLMTVTNHGPSTSRGVVLTDAVPAPLTYRSATSSQGTCSTAGTPVTVTCTLGLLASGDSATVRVVATTPSGGGSAGVVNTAGVTADTTDPEPANNEASHSLPTAAQANISMVKTAEQAQVVAGRPISYLLTATNQGPSQASVVTIQDDVPAAIGSVTATVVNGGGSCTVTGQHVECTTATVAANGTYQVRVNGVVAPDTAAGALRNSGSAAAQTPGDPTTDDNTSTTTTDIVTSADLGVTKTGPATVVAGDQISWEIVATNHGDSTATDVMLRDQLPAGVTFVSATGPDVTCDLVDGRIDCAAGTLAVNETRTVTVVGTVDAATADGSTITNTTSVGSATPDPTPGNNTADAATDVTTSADLAVAKSVTPDPLTAGAEALYTLRVSNDGLSDAQGVVIVDQVPDALTVIEASFDGGTCTVTGNEVRCERATLQAGSVAQVLVRVNVAADQVDAVTNAATAESDTPDPDGSDNSSEITTDVVRSADLEVVKTANKESVIAGEGVVYTLTVVNHGPSVATAATLGDTLPAGMTVSSVETSAGSCTVTGRAIACSFGDVEPGHPITVTVTAKVGSTFTGTSVTNDATVGSDVPDPVAGNNEDDVTVAVSTSADVSITKTSDPETLVPGLEFRYQLLVQNAGPSVARNVVVSDDVPAGVEVLSATYGAGAAPCNVTGQAVACSVGDVTAGQTSIVITARVLPGFGGASITNTASVTSPTTDPTPGNNQDDVTSPVIGQADMAIVKSMDPAVPVSGGHVRYRLTVTNYGPSDAKNPQFIDQLPPGLRNVVITPPPGAATCDLVQPVEPGEADNPNAPTVVCSGPAFRAGITVSGYVDADIAPGFTGTLTNTGRVSSDTIDPVADNNESTVTATPVQSADVAITKTMTPADPVPGQDVSYELTITNAGPSTATGVVVDDPVAADLDGVTATATGGVNCTVSAGNAVNCPVGSLPPNSEVTVTITGHLSEDHEGDLTNIATVAAATPDPDETNNSAEATGTSAPSANLSLTKTVLPEIPVPGEQVTWTLLMHNDGPSTARNVVLTDPLPGGLSDVEFQAPAGTTCTLTGTDLECLLDRLVPGAEVRVTVTAVLDADHTGALVNTGHVESDTPDPDPSDNDDTVTSDPAAGADLTVTKKASVGTAAPGAVITYAITTSNAGPSTARDVVVTDTPPAGLRILSVKSGDGTCAPPGGTARCTFAAIPAGESVGMVVRAKVTRKTSGTLTNTADATSSTPDGNPADNGDTAGVSIKKPADPECYGCPGDPDGPTDPGDTDDTDDNAGDLPDTGAPEHFRVWLGAGLGMMLVGGFLLMRGRRTT